MNNIYIFVNQNEKKSVTDMYSFVCSRARSILLPLKAIYRQRLENFIDDVGIHQNDFLSPWLKEILKFHHLKPSRLIQFSIDQKGSLSPWLKKILKFHHRKTYQIDDNSHISEAWNYIFNRPSPIWIVYIIVTLPFVLKNSQWPSPPRLQPTPPGINDRSLMFGGHQAESLRIDR